MSLAQSSSLFSSKKSDGSLVGREDWIRQVFSRRIDFLHRGERYYYIPREDEISTSISLLSGRIGRQVRSEENSPPEQGLEDVRRDPWKASVVIIDPYKHDDGQKLAMEVRSGMGSPFSVLKSLVSCVSNLIEAPYIIDIRPLTDPSGFWDFVNENKGDITSITLEFIAPNMFGIGDDMDKEWDSLKENEGANRLVTKIENERGLNPNTDRVELAVDYASKGGGSVSARTKSGKRYNSKSRIKKIIIDDVEKGKKIPIKILIEKIISGIFGR